MLEDVAVQPNQLWYVLENNWYPYVLIITIYFKISINKIISSFRMFDE
jgi:hypothetical protein